MARGQQLGAGTAMGAAAVGATVTARLDEGVCRLGYPGFRSGQREAIETLLAVGRLLLVAPTGGGKSLVYQLPASLLPGTTLVVSPLIALMHDQVAALEQRGVAATFLASTLDGDEIRRRMGAVARGEHRLVYVAPERLVHDGFRSLLADIECPLVAVDEAHCISEWGHDFRPEYMQIGALLDDLAPPRVLACTATATPVVRDEILEKLHLPPDTPQHVHGFARPNLALRVDEVTSKRAREQAVDAALAEALGAPGGRIARDGGGAGDGREVPDGGRGAVDGRGTADARGRGGAAIVYAPTRRLTEEEAGRLQQQGWVAAAYHAGLDGETRDDVQRRFSAGTLEVVVATNAFGMGIDRADVRLVVHLAPPGSIEAYYQEVGRAGRDGDPAIGQLLTGPGDLALRRRFIEGDSGGNPDDPLVKHKWNMFLELMRWAEGGSCRHDTILRYFGDEAETLAGCGRCDVCLSWEGGRAQDSERVALLVRQGLSAVGRVHGRFGLGLAARLLKGGDDDRLARTGLSSTTTFGLMRDLPEEWILRLLRRCVTAGWVDLTGGDRPVALVTEEGKEVMWARRPARLLLPPERRATAAARGDGAARKRQPSGTRANVDEEALDAIGLRLFEALRQYRLTVSRAQGVPPYVVASDRSLRDLARLRPTDLEGLQAAHGIGPSKAERYGAGLLAVLTAST